MMGAVSERQAAPAAIQEGLFRGPGEAPRLLASRCRNCGELTFPVQEGCPACAARDSETVELSPRGQLWTFTIQRFPPPPPFAGPADRESYQPFGVGYVELPEGIRVEGRLTESDPAKLEIGMEMELVLVPFRFADGSETRTTFAFRPVAHEEESA